MVSETENPTPEPASEATVDNKNTSPHKAPIVIAEDEEGVIEYNDEVMIIDRETATMIAEEGLITYRVLDLYDSDDKNAKIRSARSLSKTPPILEFFTIDKETAEPVSVQYQLTAHVTEHLANTLTQLDKAYKNKLYTGSDEDLKNMAERSKDWVLDHKIKATTLSILIALFVGLTICSIIGQ